MYIYTVHIFGSLPDQCAGVQVFGHIEQRRDKSVNRLTVKCRLTWRCQQINVKGHYIGSRCGRKDKGWRFNHRWQPVPCLTAWPYWMLQGFKKIIDDKNEFCFSFFRSVLLLKIFASKKMKNEKRKIKNKKERLESVRSKSSRCEAMWRDVKPHGAIFSPPGWIPSPAEGGGGVRVFGLPCSQIQSLKVTLRSTIHELNSWTDRQTIFTAITATTTTKNWKTLLLVHTNAR